MNITVHDTVRIYNETGQFTRCLPKLPELCSGGPAKETYFAVEECVI